jgi:multiple sugar transport system substrate-binding protein
MDRWKACTLPLFGMTLIALATIGCSGKSGNEAAAIIPDKPLEPVTLKLYESGGYFTEQDFQELIAGPVKKKYPHLTVERKVNGDLPNLVAAGETVDFFVTWHGAMSTYKPLGLYGDITALAKKHNFDLNRFIPQGLEQLREISDKGELYALPYATIISVLYYNKDIFDKFGVAYPQDGMTWDNAIDLARKVTRQDGGVDYQGMDVPGLYMLYPLSPNFVDPKTDKVLLPNVETYKKAFEMAKLLYSIPGNAYEPGRASAQFIKKRNLAMLADENRFLLLRETTGLNWDVAQYPSYKEQPNTGLWNTMHVIIPMQTSKHRDDQMRVMEVLFSDDVQEVLVKKTARVSALKDSKFKQLFGMDIPELRGKRLESIFKSTNAPIPSTSIYYSKASSLLTAEYINAVTDKKDVNTALRDAQEQIQKYVESEKKK